MKSLFQFTNISAYVAEAFVCGIMSQSPLVLPRQYRTSRIPVNKEVIEML